MFVSFQHENFQNHSPFLSVRDWLLNGGGGGLRNGKVEEGVRGGGKSQKREGCKGLSHAGQNSLK